MIRRLFLFFGALCLLASCAPNALLRKELVRRETKFHDHIGLAVYDPVLRKTLFDFNADKYFTPASNTKIFTFYTSLQVIGDSIPGLEYVIRQDSLIFWGTGDPSFLYSQSYSNTRVYDFLKSAPQKLYFSNANFQNKHFGPGWAWDDYLYPYSSERSSFPVFGNYFEVIKAPDGHLTTLPPLFMQKLVKGDSVSGKAEIFRDVDSNNITFFPGRQGTASSWQVPFHASTELIVSLLSDTLKRKVESVAYPVPKEKLILQSVPSDSLYKTMMQVSDNFIAEQLLLVCGGTLSDTLNSDITIRYARKNLLFDLPDEPVWVDGSGLSRYNLFTPRSVVRLWEKIYQKVPKERLFSLLAAGSQRGTLKNWYKADKPYIFGKTGSLSNNHTLSGYLVTRKNRILIFSFMNTHFVAPSMEIRQMMQDILLRVRNDF